MSGALTSAMFSLYVREDELVNAVEPGLMPEVGVEQPEPEPIMNVNVGALQFTPTRPVCVTRTCSVAFAPVVPVHCVMSPLLSVRTMPKPTLLPVVYTDMFMPAVPVSEETTKTRGLPLPKTCIISGGEAVPTPTLPLAEMSMELVGAPGRMRNGRREPLVRSRTNQFASFAPMSQVQAVKPPPLVCSWRMAGVSVAVMWRFRPGELLPKPTLPLEATKIEFVGAAAVMVNGTFEPVMSSIENLFEPPQASLAVSCQTLFGQPAVVDVSWNLMRVWFSLRRIVSKPNDSLFTQSRPTQRLPWMIASSAVTTSFGVGFSFPGAPLTALLAVTFGVFPGAGPSLLVTNEPFSTVNAPDSTTGSPMPASALIS